MVTPKFDNFERLLKRLLKVTHNEIKEKLEKEKAAKRTKNRRSKKTTNVVDR
jgi:hypothetical protein